MENVISTHELTKQYRSVLALDNLDFEVPAGSIFGLLGPNGAGKTTTLDLLVNLQRPTSGEAVVLGVDSRRLQGNLFENIGYVSENQEFPDWMTIGYLLEYLKPFYPSWDDARTADMVDQFRLPLDRKFRNLSRGMKMKASLASSMAYRPKLLILDEPFSGLDPLTRDELIQGLLASSPETTVVISSHDLAEIESFVSHVAYLSQGRLQFSEELSTLTARFREITVTLEQAIQPDPWPAHWICPEPGSSCMRFIDTRFDVSRTHEEIRVLFKGVTHIETSAMPLRSIFLSLARVDSRAG